MFKTATVAQLAAEAVRFQAEAGAQFEVRPNGYGVRIECKTCRVAATHDRAYRFPQEHVC